MTLDDFFDGHEDSRELFETLYHVIESIGPAQLRVGKSQTSFRRRTAFAWAWVPARCLRGDHAPLVLTVSLRRHDLSSRWKEVVEPTKGRFTHHLELRSSADIDEEVSKWLREAWDIAG